MEDLISLIEDLGDTLIYQIGRLIETRDKCTPNESENFKFEDLINGNFRMLKAIQSKLGVTLLSLDSTGEGEAYPTTR